MLGIENRNRLLSTMSWTMLPLKSMRSPLSSAMRTSIRSPMLSFKHPSRAYSIAEDIDLLEAMGIADMPPSPPPGSFPNPFRESEKKAKALTQAINPTYYLYVHSSRNNTIVTFTRPDGGTLKWWSGGSCGFKKANRAGYEAGYQCAVRAFAKIVEEAKSTPLTVGLRFKGFGQGREALYKALMASEGEAVRPLVVEVEDRTPIKIGGTRSKKTRRL